MSQDDAPRPRPRPRPAPADAAPAPRPVEPAPPPAPLPYDDRSASPDTAPAEPPPAPLPYDDRSASPDTAPAEPPPAPPAPAQDTPVERLPDPESPAAPLPDREPRPTRSARRRAQERTGRRGMRIAVLLGRLVAVLAVVAGVIVFVVARRDGAPSASTAPDTATASPQARLDDPTLAQSFVSAAVSEVVAVTESDYRRLDDTLQAGLQVTTGSFRTSFRNALTGSQAADRRARKLVTSLDVLASGIGRMSADGRQGKVLIFGRLHQSGSGIAASDSSVVTTLCLTLQRTGSQYLISDLTPDANAGVPPGTTGLVTAAEAARSEVVATLSYRRSAFPDDLARAKAGAAGTLLEQITKGSAATLSRMTKGGYDLSGAVTALAAQQVTDNAAVFLVAATGSRVADGGATSTDSDNHYAVVVQRNGNAWIATSITPVQ